LTKIFIFNKIFDVWPKFGFLIKFSVFEKTDFFARNKITAIHHFGQKLNLWQIFFSLVPNILIAT